LWYDVDEDRSAEYADRYLGEFAFRSNHRQMGNAMFDLLIAAI
jgi:transposase